MEKPKKESDKKEMTKEERDMSEYITEIVAHLSELVYLTSSVGWVEHYLLFMSILGAFLHGPDKVSELSLVVMEFIKAQLVDMGIDPNNVTKENLNEMLGKLSGQKTVETKIVMPGSKLIH